jgi:type IV secretory pathway TrbL component
MQFIPQILYKIRIYPQYTQISGKNKSFRNVFTMVYIVCVLLLLGRKMIHLLMPSKIGGIVIDLYNP